MWHIQWFQAKSSNPALILNNVFFSINVKSVPEIHFPEFVRDALARGTNGVKIKKLQKIRSS